MANGNERLVWIDLEMTGLDPRTDEIVDVRSAEAIARDKDYFQTKSAIFNALIDSH